MLLDLFYSACRHARFSSACWFFVKACDACELLRDSMDYIIAGIATVLMFGYLIYALLRPERF